MAIKAAQTQLIPASQFAPGEIAALRNEVVKNMLNHVMGIMSIPEERLVVRDIRPNGDLDYTYEDWGEATGTTADAYEDMCDSTMGTDRWVGIYGVKDDEFHACSNIKINVGGADKAIWTLQQLLPEDDFVGFSPSAIIIPQNIIYTISRYVRSASTPSQIVLLGVVIETRGKVVSP